MDIFFIWASCGLAAYLIGAIPFGFLLARMRGYDIRTLGSGNIGATNVLRSVSKPLGILTFGLDFLKGYLSTAWLPLLIGKLLNLPATGGLKLMLFCGVLTVVGHNWTIFLGFKGGKGVATSAGLLLGLAPQAVLLALLAWGILFLASGYVSLASIGAAVILGVSVWWPLHLYQREGSWFPLALTLLALMAIWKHRSNIVRLRAGTEARFNFKNKQRVV